MPVGVLEDVVIVAVLKKLGVPDEGLKLHVAPVRLKPLQYRLIDEAVPD